MLILVVVVYRIRVLVLYGAACGGGESAGAPAAFIGTVSRH